MAAAIQLIVFKCVETAASLALISTFPVGFQKLRIFEKVVNCSLSTQTLLCKY